MKNLIARIQHSAPWKWVTWNVWYPISRRFIVKDK